MENINQVTFEQQARINTDCTPLNENNPVYHLPSTCRIQTRMEPVITPATPAHPSTHADSLNIVHIFVSFRFCSQITRVIRPINRNQFTKQLININAT